MTVPFQQNTASAILVVYSDLLDMVSGVPQDRPLLFWVYRNNNSEATISSARLFADDCLLFRRIKKAEDATFLQKDHGSPRCWKNGIWNGRCVSIRNTQPTLYRDDVNTTSRHTTLHYIVHGHTVEEVDNGKYLHATQYQQRSNLVDKSCQPEHR